MKYLLRFISGILIFLFKVFLFIIVSVYDLDLKSITLFTNFAHSDDLFNDEKPGVNYYYKTFLDYILKRKTYEYKEEQDEE